MVKIVPTTLRSNFQWTFIGNCIYFVSQWGMLTVLVKWGSPDVVGKYAFALTIITPVLTFAMMQLKQVQVTDTSEQFEFKDYISTRILTVFLGLLGMNLFIWFGHYSLETKIVILIMSLAKWIDSISDIIRGIFQKYERMSYASISLIIKGLSGLGIVALLFYFTHNLVITLWGLSIVWFLSLLFYDIPKGAAFLCDDKTSGLPLKLMIPDFSYSKMRGLVRISLSLGIVLGIGSLQTFLPRFFLEKYYGEALLGYFAAISYPLAVGNMVIAALTQSALPRLAKYFDENIKYYKILFIKLIILGLLIGAIFILLVILFGRQALSLLYRPDYSQYQSAFILMAVSGAISFLSAFCGTGITAARWFNIQMIFSGIATAGTAIAAFFLIPGHAIIGASVTMIVTSGLMLICYLGGVLYLIHHHNKKKTE